MAKSGVDLVGFARSSESIPGSSSGDETQALIGVKESGALHAHLRKEHLFLPSFNRAVVGGSSARPLNPTEYHNNQQSTLKRSAEDAFGPSSIQPQPSQWDPCRYTEEPLCVPEACVVPEFPSETCDTLAANFAETTACAATLAETVHERLASCEKDTGMLLNALGLQLYSMHGDKRVLEQLHARIMHLEQDNKELRRGFHALGKVVQGILYRVDDLDTRTMTVPPGSDAVPTPSAHSGH